MNIMSRIKHAVEQFRAFDLAGFGPAANFGRASSPDNELTGVLDLMQGRAWAALQNDAYLTNGVQAWVSHGAGISPHIKRYGEGSPSPDLERVHREFLRRTAIDFDDRVTVAGLQRQWLRAIIAAGEVLMVRRWFPAGENLLNFRVVLREPAFIDESRDGMLHDGGEIRHGIEYDGDGRRVALYLFEHDPREYHHGANWDSKRVPAREAKLHFLPMRPGQSRGIPWGHAAISALKNLKHFQEATLDIQKVAACMGVVIIDEHGKVDQDQLDAFASLRPGLLRKLSGRLKIETIHPPQSTSFRDFINAQLERAAAGLHLPIELLSGNHANAKYTSMRSAMLNFYKTVGMVQEDLVIAQFCGTLDDWIADSMILHGLDCGDCFTAWCPPRQVALDPNREMKATIDGLKAGVLSPQEVWRERGREPSEVLDEIEQFERETVARKIRLFPGWQRGKRAA